MFRKVLQSTFEFFEIFICTCLQVRVRSCNDTNDKISYGEDFHTMHFCTDEELTQRGFTLREFATACSVSISTASAVIKWLESAKVVLCVGKRPAANDGYTVRHYVVPDYFVGLFRNGCKCYFSQQVEVNNDDEYDNN